MCPEPLGVNLSEMTSVGGSGFHPAFILIILGFALAGLIWWRGTLRRALQVLSACLFLGLLWLAAYSGRPDWPVDLFLFSDPLLALVHSLAGRVLVPLLLVSLAFLVLAGLMGRVFCSHVCPLGALVDLGDRSLAAKPKAKTNRAAFRRARKIKLAVLAVVIGTAVAGFNLLGFVDPLVLSTRVSATLLYPAVQAVADAGLEVARPVAGWLDWTALAYAQFYRPAFEGALGTLAIVLALLLLSRLQPRFWCRHLCPLGALLGLAGTWAPYRRRVSEACTNCDICTRRCPTGAIHPGGKGTDQRECVVCLQCVRVCPEEAVRFGFDRADPVLDAGGPNLTRRGFTAGLVGGLASGLALRSDLAHSHGGARPRYRPPGRLIRPPGALPEPEFLSRCVRCGECMRACLTNTLQPDWHRAGLEGLWAPRLEMRHAHCEYSCNVCGLVCPTEAIRPLSVVEKQHARIGTAVIDRNRCFAWAEDRRCQVCDEICPYNAIHIGRQVGHKVGLPVVESKRCSGCGTCEEVCPVGGDAAIQIYPQHEIRLSEGSYVDEAAARGFDFSLLGGPRDEFYAPEPGTGAQPGQGAAPALPPGIDLGPSEGSPADPPPLPPGIDLDG